MAIFINENTPILIQGFTGRIGTFHAQEMIDYGSNVVRRETPRHPLDGADADAPSKGLGPAQPLVHDDLFLLPFDQ